MTPEQFAMHATPINKSAIYTVYRPNLGYRGDKTFERCEEYDNVILAIEQAKAQLKVKKDKYKRKKNHIPTHHKANFEEKYQFEISELEARLSHLEQLKEEIKTKHGIISKYGKEPEFTQLLLDELYRIVEPERFEAAVRVAKQKFAELTQK